MSQANEVVVQKLDSGYFELPRPRCIFILIMDSMRYRVLGQGNQCLIFHVFREMENFESFFFLYKYHHE
jgi:hypothetical protein